VSSAGARWHWWPSFSAAPTSVWVVADGLAFYKCVVTIVQVSVAILSIVGQTGGAVGQVVHGGSAKWCTRGREVGAMWQAFGTLQVLLQFKIYGMPPLSAVA
jgi:hypothetical protein